METALVELVNRFNSDIKSIRIILGTYTFYNYSPEGIVTIVSIKNNGLSLIK